mgnify:FL=1
MLQTGMLVRRKVEYRDSYWKDQCKYKGFKVDEVFAVDYVEGNFTVYFQGDAARLGGWTARYFEKVDADLPETISNTSDSNMVNNPKHYEFFEGVEAITIIARSMTEKQFAGYCMGNALKYRLRAGKKFNTEEDLKKADYYKELFQKHRHECIDEDI